MVDVHIQTPTHRLRGYVARPMGAGPWPGVVIHDALGMSDDLRRQADWLAAAGYLTVAPNLFSYGHKVACMFATMREALAGHGPCFDDIKACRQWLVDQAECSGRIGIIGFCLGGGFALQMAPGHGFAASSVNYGQGRGDPLITLRDACPIVASFGGKDRTLRGAAQKLEQALTQLGIAHDVKEYPEVGHSFLNDHRTTGSRIMFTLMRPLLGPGYHEASAHDARQRILAFFEEHLKLLPVSSQSVDDPS